MTAPIVTIDATGAHRPTFATVLAWAVAQFQAIYGADVVLDSSTQDGELVGLFASAMDDANAMAVQIYNAYSPSTAQGTGLSSVVKINGIARDIPSYSTAPMLIGGQAGTVISSGRIADASYTWALPSSVTIPSVGQITVTATCETLGAIYAAIGTINQIVNTQPGWQTATNTAASSIGAPVETDAQLRIRQSLSTMNSSTALAQGLTGSLLALPGVNRARVYENDGDGIDANGIPAHCISVVIDGGDSTSIATTIKAKKGGCGTYGFVTRTVTDAYGIPTNVSFFVAAQPEITVAISIRQLFLFTNDVISQIQSAVSTWINALGIGNGVQWNRLYGIAYLSGTAQGQTFEITAMSVARDGASPTPADVAVLFREAPHCSPSSVTVTVVA